MTRPPFPAVFDSTIVAALRSCPQKAHLEFVEHFRPKTQSVHLHAGAAFAAGLETARKAFWLDSRGVDDAIGLGAGALLAAYGDFECPSDSAKSAERTLGAYEYAMSIWPIEQTPPILLPGGRRAIEFSFSHPLPIDHPETNEPLLYVGRMDQIVTFAGKPYTEDDKTTSQLGASWARSWDLRSQFTGYCWGARESGIHVEGTLVRGVSILKTKYDHAEAITYRPKWMIDRWYTQMLRDVTRFKAAWEEGYYDYALDHACVEYGGCPFRQVCGVEDPTEWLEQFFERRRWDPVSRTETKLDEGRHDA